MAVSDIDNAQQQQSDLSIRQTSYLLLNSKGLSMPQDLFYSIMRLCQCARQTCLTGPSIKLSFNFVL